MSEVRCASISELCVADHLNDERRIADWLSNNSPEKLRSIMKDSERRAFVAEIDGQIAGFGSFDLNEGKVLLNYVVPTRRFSGVSSALLHRMETELATAGHHQVRLTSTVTAQQFYLSRGYDYEGEGGWDWGYPMVKRLPVKGA